MADTQENPEPKALARCPSCEKIYVVAKTSNSGAHSSAKRQNRLGKPPIKFKCLDCREQEAIQNSGFFRGGNYAKEAHANRVLALEGDGEDDSVDHID